MSGLKLILNFGTLTALICVLVAHAVGWWRIRHTNGVAIRRLSEMFLVLAAVFVIFWLVRLNTIQPVVPVAYSYAILQDWIWVLYLALTIAVARCRP